ncbi:ATP-binding protein [Paenibacillus tarimensis]
MQWKLTLFYILTTIVVMLILEMIVVLGYYGYFNYNTNRMLAIQVGSVAQNAASNFSGPFINRFKLYEALKDWPMEIGTKFQGYSAAIDPEGRLIAAAGEYAPEEGELERGLPASVRQHIQTALALEPTAVDILTTYTYEEKGTVYIVAPIANKKAIKGTLVVKAEHLRFSFNNFREFMPNALQFFGLSLLGFFVGAAIVGIAFGIVTSRNLVRRIRRILTSADRWSQGDFTTYVSDPSDDELGQLANRLNQMAKQLKQLLRTRQDLATLEERNRIARELHDSIKQQMFAISIWVNTAKSLIGQDELAARTHLAEAENLISHTQRELSALILELRPVAMEDKDLAHALEDYAHVWQEQTGIAADFEASGGHQVAPFMEEAFFRVTQEALSNAARHSGASAVKIRLECGELVTLSIRDNGCGFDVRRPDRQGVGLSSMRERIQALGGHIDIRSEKGSGTIITVRCPQMDSQKRID